MKDIAKVLNVYRVETSFLGMQKREVLEGTVNLRIRQGLKISRVDFSNSKIKENNMLNKNTHYALDYETYVQTLKKNLEKNTGNKIRIKEKDMPYKTILMLEERYSI